MSVPDNLAVSPNLAVKQEYPKTCDYFLSMFAGEPGIRLLVRNRLLVFSRHLEQEYLLLQTQLTREARYFHQMQHDSRG